MMSLQRMRMPSLLSESMQGKEIPGVRRSSAHSLHCVAAARKCLVFPKESDKACMSGRTARGIRTAMAIFLAHRCAGLDGPRSGIEVIDESE